ncbi:MAG: hypothetical protein KC910_04665 [Candidatus Eremiobacteraeota bacterium]|nr:hypothetical protein [Candidatus Eremiobacteraeota bacterium]
MVGNDQGQQRLDRVELKLADGRSLIVGKRQQIEVLGRGRLAIGKPGGEPEYHLINGRLLTRLGDLAIEFEPTQHQTFRGFDREVAPLVPAPYLPVQTGQVGYASRATSLTRLTGKALGLVGMARFPLAAVAGALTWYQTDFVPGLVAAAGAFLAGSALTLAGQALVERATGTTVELKLHGLPGTVVRSGKGRWEQWTTAPPASGKTRNLANRLLELELKLVNGVRLHGHPTGVTISDGRREIEVPEARLGLQDGKPVIKEDLWTIGFGADGKLDLPKDAPDSLKFPNAYKVLSLNASRPPDGSLEGTEEEVLVNEFSVAIRPD